VAYRDQVAYLVEVPVEGGGRLVVEAGPSLLPSGLELASSRPGEIVARARESLEESLDQIQPALTALAGRLRAMAPEEFTVEFGLTFGVDQRSTDHQHGDQQHHLRPAEGQPAQAIKHRGLPQAGAHRAHPARADRRRNPVVRRAAVNQVRTGQGTAGNAGRPPSASATYQDYQTATF